jgi:hypothetical protein
MSWSSGLLSESPPPSICGVEFEEEDNDDEEDDEDDDDDDEGDCSAGNGEGDNSLPLSIHTLLLFTIPTLDVQAEAAPTPSWSTSA